jgi:hypothetical protein
MPRASGFVNTDPGKFSASSADESLLPDPSVFPSLSTVMVSLGFRGKTARKIATTVRMKDVIERTVVRSKVQSSSTGKDHKANSEESVRQLRFGRQKLG